MNQKQQNTDYKCSPRKWYPLGANKRLMGKYYTNITLIHLHYTNTLIH